MKKNKPNLSLGTILALCLTAAVTVGCVYMFGIMRSKDTDARIFKAITGALGKQD